MLPAGLLVVLAASLAAVVPAAAPLPSPSGRGVGGEVRLAGPAGHCAWESEFEVGDVDGAVEALAVFDDGNGPALYAGGLFPAAGRFKASNVARWDGAKWSPLAGPSDEGTSGMVLDLAVYDDGSGPALYAAGSFIFAGGV
ncbi:MAG: hypothetical protein GY719_08020, partial [bacterium]|nr:hypothetical protein [bacterium]